MKRSDVFCSILFKKTLGQEVGRAGVGGEVWGKGRQVYLNNNKIKKMGKNEKENAYCGSFKLILRPSNGS